MVHVIWIFHPKEKIAVFQWVKEKGSGYEKRGTNGWLERFELNLNTLHTYSEI